MIHVHNIYIYVHICNVCVHIHVARYSTATTAQSYIIISLTKY